MSKRCLGCMQTYEEGDICPYCGYAEGTPPEEAIQLVPGTILHNRYLIGKSIGSGGFGVTYIGFDEVLQMRVAIKEYLPSEFATRVPGQSQVLVFEGDKAEQFRDGMRKFVEEAKILAKFQNEPGIVRIYDAFMENETAYGVMEYLDGETLESYLNRNGMIPEDQAVQMLMPVMESLKAVHAAGIIHRDIAPENIMLTKDGQVRLIDFGASRYATTSHSRSLTVIIKPGYSPEEQYRSRGDQGPHTDVYSLAATLYRMITGKIPPDALERRAMYENKNRDIITEPHVLNKNISQVRENALMNALNVKIEDRTPDIPTFLGELNAQTPAKRIYGSIRQMNFFRMPTWMKITVPAVLALLLTFAVLLLTGVIDFDIFSQEIVIPDGVVIVPDVETLNNDEAIAKIEGATLLAVTAGNVESEYIEAGTIVYQTPMGGSYMARSAQVMLTVSRGKILGPDESTGMTVVPYVIWSTLEEALEAISEAGLGEPEITEAYDDNVAEGQIISQNPEYGTEVEINTVIQITVSLGPQAFEMPNVTGMQQAEAEELLLSKGLAVTVSYVQDDSVPEGQIMEQSIPEGSPVHRGDAVIITAAAKVDTIAVADVSGKKRKEAEKILKDQGFNVVVLENYDDTVEKGDVINQTPDAGTQLKAGDTVTIYVSKGAEYSDSGSASETEAIAEESEATTAAPTTAAPTTAAPTTAAPTTAAPTTAASTTAASTTAAPTTAAPTTAAPTTAAPTTAAPTTAAPTTAAPTTAAPTTAEPTTPAPPQTYTVSFDTQGGSAASAITVTQGSTYGNLPSSSRTGFDFMGWFTASSGGTQVTSSTTVNLSGNQTLYAQWSVQAALISWNDGSGAFAVSVQRTSSPYAGAANGALSNGSTVYYGDVISYTFTANAGYTITSGDSGTITIAEGGGTNFIADPTYSVNAYTVTWNDAAGCTISVSRTSSPYAGAGTGDLPKGSTVYYGDVLNVSYGTTAGYTLSSNGATSVTVTGDIGASQIYANATSQNITYNVVYQSSNGTGLGSSTATYAYGTTNTISAPGYSGYATPGAQSVAWDSTTPKTIVFTYAPNGVGAQYLCNNKWWWNHNNSGKGITTTIYVTYSNRTANSVAVHVVWQQTITKGFYYGYTQTVKVTVGNKNGSNSIASSVWASSSNSARTETRTMDFTVTGLSATQTSVSYSVNCSASADNAGSWSGTIAIPAY